MIAALSLFLLMSEGRIEILEKAYERAEGRQIAVRAYLVYGYHGPILSKNSTGSSPLLGLFPIFPGTAEIFAPWFKELHLETDTAVTARSIEYAEYLERNPKRFKLFVIEGILKIPPKPTFFNRKVKGFGQQGRWSRAIIVTSLEEVKDSGASRQSSMRQPDPTRPGLHPTQAMEKK